MSNQSYNEGIEATAKKLADDLERLSARHPEPWRPVEEPHDYNDGTTHFTHVEYVSVASWSYGVRVRIADSVTPDTAELLCLLQNNLVSIVAALRRAPAKDEAAIRADEREQCARCIEGFITAPATTTQVTFNRIYDELVAAIRARGSK